MIIDFNLIFFLIIKREYDIIYLCVCVWGYLFLVSPGDNFLMRICIIK